VLPGVVSRETVLANHCSEFIQSPFARTGNLEGNPLHRDMLYAAETAKLAFIVNVVINSDKRIVKAVAGHFRRAHEAGCGWLKDICRVRVPESDIVITSNGGYPLDQNVYQAVKGMTAAEAVCRPGGVIVMVASCADGHGGESFFRNLAESPSPEAVLEKVLGVPRTATRPDQWEFQILARILSRHTVIVVTRDCDHAMLGSMHLRAASTLEEALRQADAAVGSHSRIAVIPDGVSVIAEKI
jgi:nickel-dependent lactate racemase